MMPVSPIQVDVKPESSCNDWKCCFGWVCCKPKEEESPVSVEIVEKVTRTFERHRHSHSASPEICTSPIPRLPAPPPLLRVTAIKEMVPLDELNESFEGK